MDMLDTGVICVQGGTEQASVRFHHSTQEGMPFKTHALFISGISQLIFLEHG